MPVNVDPLEQKQTFLQDNELFSEMELNEQSKPIGKLHEIDLSENEIWLLQCPKGMNVAELENQKLKIPGRTNVNDSEAISMEFNNGKEQHAFASHRKGRYSLRLLPVRGTIVIRNRLKNAETVTGERVEECCPPAKRVPLPSAIRVRHPLLGSQYEDKISLDKTIIKRLQNADKVSAQVLKESMIQKHLTCSENSRINNHGSGKNPNDSVPIEIDSADDDGVEFISEEKLKKKKKKSKRKHSESLGEQNLNDEANNKKKAKKSRKDDETVADDLQWLQNI